MCPLSDRKACQDRLTGQKNNDSDWDVHALQTIKIHAFSVVLTMESECSHPCTNTTHIVI